MKQRLSGRIGIGVVSLVAGIAVLAVVLWHQKNNDSLEIPAASGTAHRSIGSDLTVSGNTDRKRLPKLSPDNNAVPTANALFNFEPEGFDAAWQHIISNFTPESERNLFLRQIAIRMASLGHASEALAAITKSFGEGSVRSDLITGCVSYCNSPELFLAAFTALEAEKDKLAAVGGLRNSMALYMSASGGNFDIDKYNFDFLSKKEFDMAMIGAATDFYIQTISGSRDASPQAIQAVLAMGLDSAATGEFLNVVARFQPFDAWREYSLRTETVAPEIGRQIAAAMVAEDPARAVSIIANSGGDTALATAVYTWGSLERSKAFEWFGQASPGLGVQQRLGAATGLSHLLADQGSFKEAWELADTIKDPAMQQKLKDQIWGWQRDTLRKEAGKDPAGTLQAIVSGESKYADYWIEEAMVTWVSKDFTKAQEWYQENWKSLPAEKSQYVAAAFATQAMGQGDTVAARQWASYIRNAKTKQRIEAAIAKAEGQSGN